MNKLFLKDLISARDLKREDVLAIFDKADEMECLVREKGADDRLKGRIITALFTEPSTRTFSSFITAAQRLGAGFIPLNGKSNTSLEKGETFTDTIKVLANYSDALVVRTPDVGSAKKASLCSDKPVINAGDGQGEHPSQGLLDAYCIYKNFKDLGKIKVALTGDLLYGRTVHSLSYILALLGVKYFYFISPDNLKMPVVFEDEIKNLGAKVIVKDDYNDLLVEIDVIYLTRVQKERFADPSVYEKLKNKYIFNETHLKRCKKDALIMHPLPRIVELDASVDNDKRAVYLNREIKCGLYVRMAILDLILNR